MKSFIKRLNLIILTIISACCLLITVGNDKIVKASDGVKLKDGNYERWIDRIDFTGQDYALEFYDWLIENSDGDGENDLLIDASQQSYVIEKIVETISYEGDPEDEVKQATDQHFERISNYAYAVYGAFNRDYPQVFWLSGDVRIGCNDVSYSYTVDTITYTLEVVFLIKNDDFDVRESCFVGAGSLDILQERLKMEQAIEQILNGIGDHALDSEKVEYFNKWLIENNCYRVGEITAKNRMATSALLSNDANSEFAPVCEGYARALKVLCDRVNIPCTLISGKAKGEAHMWNAVKLDDGKWYGVDATWNDPSVSGITDKKSGAENTDYLFVGSETSIGGYKFSSSHKVENTVFVGGFAYVNGPVLSIEKYASPEKVNEWDCSNLADESVLVAMYKTEEYTILNPAYKLIIWGNGEIKDYENAYSTPWFSFLEHITEIEIKDGITQIGKYAFSKTSITKVVFSESVIKICDYAFSDCENLEEIIVLSMIATCEENSFLGCDNLEIVKAHENSQIKEWMTEREFAVEFICEYNILKYNDDTHWYECECGAYKEWSAHNFGQWEIVQDATTSEEGLKERTCECGRKEHSKIEKKPTAQTQFDDLGKEQIEKLIFYGAIILGGIIIISIIIGLFKKKNS